MSQAYDPMGTGMAIWKRLVAAVLPLLLSASIAVAQTEQRVALVIGNSNYLSVGKLKNPANDASAMAALLRHVGFDVIEQENLTRRAMIQAVRTFAEKLSPGGIGLLYYAGHGVQAQGANYLVPVDAALTVEDDLKYETLDLQDILNKLDDARVRLSIVILDACRDNPFKSFRSSRGGLALINPPSGTVIVYATAPGKVAADGSGDNSVFTTELLKAMSKPDKLLDVFEHVTEAVQRQTGNAQTPWMNSSFRGDFYFTGPATVNVAPPPAPAAAAGAMAAGSLEIVFWQSIASSTNPADFEAYLTQFPQGSFVALARVRLASLSARPVPAQPPLAPDLRPPDARDPKAPVAPSARRKPSPPDPASTQKAPPASKDMPPVARTKPEPLGVQPVQHPAAPPQSSRAEAAPPAPRPTQEAMVRPPLAGAVQPQPSDAIPPRPAEPAPPPESSHAAPLCKVPPFYGMETGAGAYATIRVANTGDRCGIRVQTGGKPFNSLSLSKSPRHGSVIIEGSAFYYTPAPGFVGNDDFAIDSSPWGSVRAVVTVVPPQR
jgi:hypothetical protein